MSQSWTETIDPASTTGTALAALLNDIHAAIASQHSGTSAPAYIQRGMLWYDQSTNEVKINDGSNNLVVCKIDPTNHLVIPPVGGGTEDIASAATTDLGSKSAATLRVTGTTTITGFGTSMKPGQIKFLNFAGALLLTHNETSLIIPGGDDITTAAGDAAVVKCESSGNYRLLAFVPAALNPALNPVKRVVQQVFVASGTYTPDPAMLYVKVEVVGGGGGGGGAVGAAAPSASAGGGGGAGGYTSKIFSAADIGASQTVTIGGGGDGGAAGLNDGATAGSTTFGAFLTANGGAGGAATAATATDRRGGRGGQAGVAGGGIFNVGGSAGGHGHVYGSQSLAVSGAGGRSSYGGGAPSVVEDTAGATAVGYGYGGGGGGAAASTTSSAGGDGAPGLCIVTEFCWK